MAPLNPTEDLLVMAEGVLLMPVSDLPTDIIARLDIQGGEYAISRRGVRTTTQIIDGDAAALLEEFRVPKTIAEAISDYCRRCQQDPTSTLREALSFIESLAALRVLVSPEDRPTGVGQPSFQIGEQFKGHKILAVARTFEDSEIYQVSGTNGESLALKIGHSSIRTEFLTREAAILRRLGADHSPQLWETGSYHGRPYLLMEWCSGTSADVVAQSLRAADGAISAELLNLCISILEAYADLHRQGVIHGDVHPHNLLISEKGEVKIIDFGLSRLDSPEPMPNPPPRGGISFFFEPEYAQALLDNSLPPEASPRGEQYALAALIYLLLQGKPYLDFSLERGTGLRQILEDDPEPFVRGQGCAVEKVLQIGLSKDPRHRFASLDDFLQAMQSAAREVAGSSSGDSNKASAAFETVQYEKNQSPYAYHGTAGVAYTFYRAACLRDESRLLALAELWIHQAGHELTRHQGPTENSVSFYQGACGIHTVQTLVKHAQNDSRRAQEGLEQFNMAAGKARLGSALSLITGKAGVLLGCSILLEALCCNQDVNVFALRQTGSELFASLWGEISDLRPIREARQVFYLGMAHGWAGLLYALMRWILAAAEAVPAVVLEGIAERLGQLSELRITWPQGASWPLNPWNAEPTWVGWCHGSAGYVHLWTLAYRLYRQDEFLNLALQAGDHSWSNPHRTASLCCGLTGQAYAMLNLYKLLDERKWLERANHLLSRIGSTEPLPRVNSLYQGDAGPTLLAIDLAYPEWSAMPLFEPEGW